MSTLEDENEYVATIPMFYYKLNTIYTPPTPQELQAGVDVECDDSDNF